LLSNRFVCLRYRYNGAGGILFSSCPCVRDHILEVCQQDILFAKFTNSVQFGLWIQKVRNHRPSSRRDQIWSTKHSARHFLTYVWNAWTYFNKT